MRARSTATRLETSVRALPRFEAHAPPQNGHRTDQIVWPPTRRAAPSPIVCLTSSRHHMPHRRPHTLSRFSSSQPTPHKLALRPHHRPPPTAPTPIEPRVARAPSCRVGRPQPPSAPQPSAPSGPQQQPPFFFSAPAVTLTELLAAAASCSLCAFLW